MSSAARMDKARFERILVRVCSSKLGDLLMSLPTLEGIRLKHPEAKIILLLRGPSPGAWIERHPFVDSILWEQPKDDKQNFQKTLRLLKTLRESRFDAVIDLRLRARYAWLYRLARIPLRSAGSTKYYGRLLTHNVIFDFDTQDRHEVEADYAMATPLGLNSAPGKIVFPISEFDAAEANRLLATSGIGSDDSFMILNPTFGGSSRPWPAERFAETANAIYGTEGLRTVLIGDGVLTQETCSDILSMMPASTVDLRGRTSVPVLAALLKRAALHLSVDTGTSHLAAAMQTPCVTLFTFFEHWEQRTRWQPWSTPLRTVGPQIRCRSCSNPHEKCARKEMTCIDSVSTEQVLEASMDLLEQMRGKIS